MHIFGEIPLIKPQNGTSTTDKQLKMMKNERKRLILFWLSFYSLFGLLHKKQKSLWFTFCLSHRTALQKLIDSGPRSKNIIMETTTKPIHSTITARVSRIASPSPSAPRLATDTSADLALNSTRPMPPASRTKGGLLSKIDLIGARVITPF